MNSQYKTCAMRKKTSVKQHGVVLFIALIALVVLSLAAVALIRSVDTNTLIAGNLAFKQSATISADSGLETAIAWLGSPAVVADPTIPDNDKAAQGYYARSASLPLTDPTNPGWPGTWGNSNSAIAIGTGIDGNGTEATSGNTIRYVIQRMCNGTGPPTAGGCLFGAQIAGTSSQSVKSAPQADGGGIPTDSPMYRVTARVTGPQNTVSYIQAFVY